MYNADIVQKVKKEIDERRERAIGQAEQRRRALHAEHPDIKQIDDELSHTWIYIMEESAKGGEDLPERIEDLKQNNRLLRERRKNLLRFYGYSADHTEIKYTCPKCSDTGFDGTRMCSCMKRMLTEEGMRRAGISRLFETQRFDTFSTGYYAYDEKTFRLMKQIYEICVEYADNFDEYTVENLLFCGSTGLGKTHLSTAIAAKVIEKGFDVVYNSAQNIIQEFEDERFRKSYSEKNPASLSKYFDTDLLIIDDLGTESSTSFTVGCIYNIINSRVVAGKPMIISTNLTHEDMKRRYSDRVASRLFGEFTALYFQGKDVRFLKLSD